MRKRLISVVISAIMLSTAISVNVNADPTSDVNSQISQDSNLLKNAQSVTQSYEVQAQNMDELINKENIEINNTNKKISAVQANIMVTETDLKKAQNDMDEEQDLFDSRMRAVYEKGVNNSNGYLNVILSASSFSDMISKVETVSKISQLDKKVMKDLEAKRSVVESKKKALDKQNSDLNTYLAAKKSKVNDLNTKKQQYTALAVQAKKEESKYASQVQAEQAKLKKLQQSMLQNLSRGQILPATSNGIVSYAYNFIGCDYVYGAAGPTTFDCSGLVWYVYHHFGYNLPRRSEEQVNCGSYVSRSNLQPGDLVFFISGSDVHHVGIYAGGDSFIEAPRSGLQVRLASLSGRSDFYCGRRILK